MTPFDTVEVFPSDGTDSLLFKDVDAISLINDDTYGPAPVFANDSEFTGRVLYINPQNITAMEANK